MLRSAALFLLVLLAGHAGLAADGAFADRSVAPRRIVSIHLCADQLVLALADRNRIAALSWLATEPARSYMAAAAQGIPAVAGSAEEVVALRPDLVLAGFRSGRATVRALRALGYRVEDLRFAGDFEAIRRQIRRVAHLVGRPARGETLIADMDRRLAAARRDIPAVRPVAAIYQPMGFTSGRGSLEDALLAAAGFDNLAVRLGLGALGHLPLETVVASKPDLLVNWMGDDPNPSLSRASYAHPALARAPWRVVALPNTFWACGSWYSARAVERLADIRRTLQTGTPR